MIISQTIKNMAKLAILAQLLLAAHLVSAEEVPQLGQRSSGGTDEAPLGKAPTGGLAAGAYSGNQEPTIWKRPALLLLGDSLTELGLDPSGGWGVRLASAYARKADVINRGFAGYNTATTLLSLPEIFDSISKQKVAVATLWLGANDASRPDRSNAAAHVPLEHYMANLVSIVQQLQAAGIANVVLITPPPVWEGAPNAILPGEDKPARTLTYTSRYAAAVRSAAAQLSLPLLDVWALFEAQEGWQQQLLRPDGLHMSLAGQELVFNSLMAVIEQQLPNIKPAALPWHHPTWWFIDYANAKQQWAAEQAAYEQAFGTQSP